MELLRTALVGGALALVACQPDIDQRAANVTRTRVLAVRAEPAEVEPRDDLAMKALVVDATGAVSTSPPTWGFCTDRKPLAELGPVAPSCTVPGSPGIAVLGAGPEVKTSMPGSACRDFGPEIPTPKTGEAYGRPVDPDPTGGYYQPVSLFVGAPDAEPAVQGVRISCGVAGAPSEDVVTFRQRYHANENPAIASVTIGGVPVTDAPFVTAPNARLDVRVSWPACPAVDACGDGICGPDESRLGCPADCGGAKPKGCAGAERYLAFDADARALGVRREAMRVSWFSAGGAWDKDRVGRAEDETDAFADDAWVAPSAPGRATLVLVLRDARGGVDWRVVAVEVR